MPITKEILAEHFEAALDFEADKEVKPDEARKRVAEKLADAVELYVIGRTTIGTASNGASVTTTIQ